MPITRIESLMSAAVVTVRPRDSVAAARALIEKHRVNQLPVVVNGHLVGIVTDRDLRDAEFAVSFPDQQAGGRQRRAAGPGPERIPVEEVMTTNVLTLSPDDTALEAAQLMRRERIGAVPIVQNGKLEAIITRSDILGAYIDLTARASGLTPEAGHPAPGVPPREPSSPRSGGSAKKSRRPRTRPHT